MQDMRTRDQGTSLYRRLADISVARACGFAGLATLCVMVGMSSSVANIFRAGGYGALLTAVVLLVKARHARTRPVQRTELWVMLEKWERPPKDAAQAIMGNILEMAYLRYASLHALGACLLLLIALVASLISA